MLNHISDQIPQPLVSVIARTLVLHVAKRSLYRVRFRAVGRQIHRLNARMPLKPLPDGLGFMDFVVVHDHKNACAVAGRIGRVDQLEQVNEQAAGLAKPDAVQQFAGHYIQRPSQVVLLISAWRYDLKLRPFGHPLIADFRQQVDVEFVSNQQKLFGAELLKKPANPCQFLDALWSITLSREFGTLPDPANFPQLAAHGIGRDLKAAIDLELGREAGTPPTEPKACGVALSNTSSERLTEGDRPVVRTGGWRVPSATKSKPSEWLR